MRISLEETLKKAGGILVIDGSMATALEGLGCDLNNSLWTAKALERQPKLVKQVHLDYFRAGADCGITCSYQATIPGLKKNGCSEAEAEALIVRSVEIFNGVRENWWQNEGKAQGRVYPLCLAGIGPYGAYLAVQVLPAFIAKQQLDTFATELVREAEIAGRIGPETDRREQALREQTGLDPEIEWSDTGRIQLNEEVTVTLTHEIDLGLFAGFGSFPITLRADATGKSEVYWK